METTTMPPPAAAGRSRPVRVVITFLKAMLGTFVVGALLFAGLAAYNAADEDLDPEASALIAPRTGGKIEDQNGYIAFLGIVAPKGEDTMAWGRAAAQALAAQGDPDFKRSPPWEKAVKAHLSASAKANQWCKPEEGDCLPIAKAQAADLEKELADESNAELLKRYRKAREVPQFREVTYGHDPAAVWPNYSGLTSGASLARLDIAMKFNAGDAEAAVAELEREVAFHRRLLASNGTLLACMVAVAQVGRDLIFTSELLRTGGAAVAPYRARLRALAKPRFGAGVLTEAFAREAQMGLSFTRDMRRNLRDMSRETAMAISLGDEFGVPVAWSLSWLVKPNETVNHLARAHAIETSVLPAASEGFDAALASAAKQRLALNEPIENAPWYGEFDNPVGKMVIRMNPPEPFLARYAARVHDLDGLSRLVELQATLAEKEITDPAAIAAFVAGEGAKSHPDPYTGKPLAFDPATRQLSFVPRGKSGTLYTGMEKRFKRKDFAVVV